MNEITYSNKSGSRMREPWLLLVKGDSVVSFEGKSIQGVLAVLNTAYTKAGKWSSTDYRLGLADGVRAISGRDGWDTGTFAEGIGAVAGVRSPALWTEMAAAIGVSVPAAMRFLNTWRPKAAARLDTAEAEICALEDSPGEDPVCVTVSFGRPTNRMIAAGWWEEPKEIPSCSGASISKIDASRGWTHGNIRVNGVDGRVLSVEHASGMHGGSYAVRVALATAPEQEMASPAPDDVRQPSDSPAPGAAGGIGAVDAALRRAGF